MDEEFNERQRDVWKGGGRLPPSLPPHTHTHTHTLSTDLTGRGGALPPSLPPPHLESVASVGLSRRQSGRHSPTHSHTHKFRFRRGGSVRASADSTGAACE